MAKSRNCWILNKTGQENADAINWQRKKETDAIVTLNLINL